MYKHNQQDKMLCVQETGCDLSHVDIITSVVEEHLSTPKKSLKDKNIKRELMDKVRVKFGVTSWVFAPYLWWVAKIIVGWILGKMLDRINEQQTGYHAP